MSIQSLCRLGGWLAAVCGAGDRNEFGKDGAGYDAEAESEPLSPLVLGTVAHLETIAICLQERRKGHSKPSGCEEKQLVQEHSHAVTVSDVC